MAEADIDSMKAMTDGVPYGTQERGAWATIQTRIKPTDLATTTANGVVELATNTEAVTGTDTVRAMTPVATAAAIRAEPAVSAATQVSAGQFVFNWAAGLHWRVSSAGFNITGVVEINGPAAGFMRQGTLEVVNTGAASLTVDLTAMPHGLEEVVTIPAGGSDLFLIWSTP